MQRLIGIEKRNDRNSLLMFLLLCVCIFYACIASIILLSHIDSELTRQLSIKNRNGCQSNQVLYRQSSITFFSNPFDDYSSSKPLNTQLTLPPPLPRSPHNRRPTSKIAVVPSPKFQRTRIHTASLLSAIPHSLQAVK